MQISIKRMTETDTKYIDENIEYMSMKVSIKKLGDT